MKQRRVIIFIAALAIGIAAYFLVFHNGYSGTFDLSCNGQEYSMELSELERTKVYDGVIYSAVFSDGSNNVKLTFKVGEDGGEAYISLDNPRLFLDGTQYHMLHSLRKNEYYVDALLDHYRWITFQNPPMNNRYFLNGRFIIEGSNLLK